MKYSLDTSVVIRLLTGKPDEHLAATEKFLDHARRLKAKVFVSDLVVAEAYHALQHHFAISKSDAIWGLSQLFSTGEIVPAGQALKILSQPGLATAKPGFVDRLIHADAVHSGCHWVTFEKAAVKLPDVAVLKAR